MHTSYIDIFFYHHWITPKSTRPLLKPTVSFDRFKHHVLRYYKLNLNLIYPPSWYHKLTQKVVFVPSSKTSLVVQMVASIPNHVAVAMKHFKLLFKTTLNLSINTNLIFLR